MGGLELFNVLAWFRIVMKECNIIQSIIIKIQLIIIKIQLIIIKIQLIIIKIQLIIIKNSVNYILIILL